jgi:hypothetical protein
LLELIAVSGKSSINLTTLTTYERAKPPRPHGDLFHPEFFEPANRLIVFTNGSIEVVVFTLALLSIWVLNQQEFREEPVPDSISRNPFLPRSCFGPVDIWEFRRFDSTFRRETIFSPLSSALPSLHILDRSFVLCPLLFPDRRPDMTES